MDPDCHSIPVVKSKVMPGSHSSFLRQCLQKEPHNQCVNTSMSKPFFFVIINTAPVRQPLSLTGIRNEGVTINEWQWFNRELSLHSRPFELGGVWIVLYYIWWNPGTRFMWKNYSPQAELPENLVILIFNHINQRIIVPGLVAPIETVRNVC